jgi:hypothetical protein
MDILFNLYSWLIWAILWAFLTIYHENYIIKKKKREILLLKLWTIERILNISISKEEMIKLLNIINEIWTIIIMYHKKYRKKFEDIKNIAGKAFEDIFSWKIKGPHEALHYDNAFQELKTLLEQVQSFISELQK